MPRRFANQVHRTTSNLLRERFIQSPPLWYHPVLQYPPIQLPARGSPTRTKFDTHPHTAAKKSAFKTHTSPKPRPADITYDLRDKIRQQFFKDHPFEAYNPRTLVEGAEIEAPHPIQGEQWTRLRQRGRNPSSEDAIHFAVNLHQHHSTPLAQAYHSAITQFRALRSELQISAAVAAQEAESYGAVFGPTLTEKNYEKEREALESWTPQTQGATTYSSKLPWSPIWKMPGTPQQPEGWTRGREYAERVQKRIPPNYIPDFVPPELQDPADEIDLAETLAESAEEKRERLTAERKATRKEQGDLLGLFH